MGTLWYLASKSFRPTIADLVREGRGTNLAGWTDEAARGVSLSRRLVLMEIDPGHGCVTGEETLEVLNTSEHVVD